MHFSSSQKPHRKKRSSDIKTLVCINNKNHAHMQAGVQGVVSLPGVGQTAPAQAASSAADDVAATAAAVFVSLLKLHFNPFCGTPNQRTRVGYL